MIEILAIALIVGITLSWYLVDHYSQHRSFSLRHISILVGVAALVRLMTALVWANGDPFDIESYRLVAQLVLARQDVYTSPDIVGHLQRHPYLPLQMYWFAGAELLSRLTTIPFVTSVKLAPIIADTGIVALVYYGTRARFGNNNLAWQLGWLYALNPLSILDASYHGQFDSITIFFALAAWYIFECKKTWRFGVALAGVLLGIAILDKTWPLIFLPLLIIHSSNWRSRITISITTLLVPAIGVVAYVATFNSSLMILFANAMRYQSIAGVWGWTQIADMLKATVIPDTDAAIWGKVMALIGLGGFYLVCAPRLKLLEGMLAAVLALFTFAPGLNVYYVMWLVPFALIANQRGWLRGFIGMAFVWLGMFYFHWNLAVPGPNIFAILALALWLYTILGLVINLRHITLPRFDPYLILLLLFSIFAISPLFAPGYFWGAHDGRHSVYFLFEFDRVIQDGIFYPRWLPDFTFGYGYPFFNIYGPGAFFVGEALHLIGFDFVTTTKIVFALAIVLSGPAMFAFVKRLTGSSQAAFLSGLAYVYIPYHIADIYVRAALAESAALIFLPLTLLGFYETVVSPSRKNFVATAFAYGAMLFAHNGIALLFTPILGIWVLFLMIGEIRRAPKSNFKSNVLRFIRLGLAPLGTLVLGMGIVATFLIPLIVEYQFVRVDQWTANYYDYSNHFVYLFQLFNPTWGFGISVPGPDDGMSFQLGIVPSLLAILSLVTIIKNPGRTRRFWLFFLGMTIIVALLMFGFSLPIWETLRLVMFAQFPWRLLTLTTVSLAVLAGAIALASNDEPRGISLSTLLLGALIVLGSFPYLAAQMIQQPAEGPISILGLFRFQQSAGEMTGSTSWVQDIPTWSPIADVYFAGKKVKSKIDYTIYDDPSIVWFGVDQSGKGLRADGERVLVDSQVDNLPVVFNTFYYPGWHAWLTNETDNQFVKDLPITPVTDVAPTGRISVTVPKGRYWLNLQFQDSPPRVIGWWISGTSLVIALGIALSEFRTRRMKAEG